MLRQAESRITVETLIEFRAIAGYPAIAGRSNGRRKLPVAVPGRLLEAYQNPEVLRSRLLDRTDRFHWS